MYKLRVKHVTITTAGIPVAGPDLRVKKVQIIAPSSNSGAVYYGSVGVTAGIYRVLAAGATDTHEAPNGEELDLSALRFDAATANDKVVLVYYEWQETADPAYVTPKEVSGLLGWWKADAITGLSDGGAITTWTDASGNGNSLTAAGSARALYKTGVQNGLAGVLFDGVNDTFEGSLTLGNYTILWASRLTAGGMLLFAEGAGEDTIVDVSGSAYVDMNRGTAGYARILAAGWTEENSIFAVRYAADAADIRVRRGGEELLGTETIPRKALGSASSSRSLWIGTRDGDYPIAGHLLEMMIFNSALPLATIEGLEKYLTDKWAL